VKKYPKRLEGTTTWDPAASERQAAFKIFILQSPTQFSIEVDYNGQHYAGTLNERTPGTFGGNVDASGIRGRHTVPVSECTITDKEFESGEYKLKGKWVEDERDNEWRADLWDAE
jgi:hypothetical protein